MTRAELYASAKKNGALIGLLHRAKWIVKGEDRVRFLNGQVSNDVRKLKPNEAIHACVLTAKGKLCGDIFISAGPDFLRIDAEPSLRESLTARLERYLIADDVTIEDVTNELSLFHFVCGETKQICFEVEPSTVKDIAWASWRFGRGGIDLVLPRHQRNDMWKSLGEPFIPIDAELAEVLRIEAGIPKWGAELDENTLPNEAGLERDAIDFHKGCYVGQEVISRIKSVGHVNRGLRGFVSDAPLFPGMEIFLPNEAAKSVGHLTSAAWSFGLEKWVALGYLKRGVDSAMLEARAADGAALAKVEVKDLPLIP